MAAASPSFVGQMAIWLNDICYTYLDPRSKMRTNSAYIRKQNIVEPRLSYKLAYLSLFYISLNLTSKFELSSSAGDPNRIGFRQKLSCESTSNRKKIALFHRH